MAGKDFLAGLLFALIGGGAVLVARGYPFGTTMRMGPGYFPTVLGYVLGPLLEEYLRRAMLLSRGDPSAFFTRPISLAFVAATVLLFAWMIFGKRSRPS